MGVYEQAAQSCGRVAVGISGWLLAPPLVDSTSRGMDTVVERDHLRVLEVSSPAHPRGREGEATLGPTEFSDSHNLTPTIVGAAAPSAASLGQLPGTTGNRL